MESRKSVIGKNQAGVMYLKCFAGKMNIEGTTVTPDSRKGILYFLKGDDNVFHLCWKDLDALDLEDDFIVSHGQMEFILLPHSHVFKIYVLKFFNSSLRKFYWIQEKRTEEAELQWITAANRILAQK